MLDAGSWMKSLETTSSVVYQDALEVRFARLLHRGKVSPWLVAFVVFTVRSTTETVGVGTRKDIPVSLPFTSERGRRRFARVVLGMMLTAAARPPFQSFFDGPSTVFCVAV